MRQPAIYLPHGAGPCFFMDWTMGPPDTFDPMEAWLRGLPASLPEVPKAILCVSAHWEASRFALSVGSERLLYDYGGFPPHTYELEWAAPPATELASRLSGMLDAPIVQRGFDHGVFIPLKVAWDVPSIPVVQLSLRQDLDPAAHLELARRLEPLRDEGVLLVGSGMSFHSIPAFFGRQDAREPSKAFNQWLVDVCARDPAGLVDWASAPFARLCHPREEHLLPLMACASGPATVDFRGTVMGAEVLALRFE